MQHLWKRIVELNRSDPDVLSKSFGTHYKKVATEEYIYISNLITLAEIASMRPGHISIAVPQLRDNFAFAVPKGSALKEKLSVMLVFLCCIAIYYLLYLTHACKVVCLMI